MNEAIYWEAQWAISELEEARREFGADYLHDKAEETALDVLLQLRRE